MAKIFTSFLFFFCLSLLVLPGFTPSLSPSSTVTKTLLATQKWIPQAAQPQLLHRSTTASSKHKNNSEDLMLAQWKLLREWAHLGGSLCPPSHHDICNTILIGLDDKKKVQQKRWGTRRGVPRNSDFRTSSVVCVCRSTESSTAN